MLYLMQLTPVLSEDHLVHRVPGCLDLSHALGYGFLVEIALGPHHLHPGDPGVALAGLPLHETSHSATGELHLAVQTPLSQ